MKTFIWTNQQQTGKVNAKNIHYAKSTLLKNAIQWETIKQQPFYQKEVFSRRIKKSNITNLFIQLTTLLDAGISLLSALEIIANDKNDKLKELIDDCYTEVKQGKSLSSILSQYPRYFDHTIITFIRTGEQTGNLEKTLKSIIKQRENHQKLINQLKKALCYPLILLSSALVITLLLLIFVVPQFQSFYASFNQQLPMLTRFVIATTKLLKQYGLMLLFFMITLYLSSYLFYQYNQRCKKFYDTLLLNLPLIGKLFRLALCIRYYTILSMSLESGLLITEAYQACIINCKNLAFLQPLQISNQMILQGHSFVKGIKINPFISMTDKKLLAAAEKSGEFSTMLAKLAKQNQITLERLSSSLITLIEPIVLLTLAIVVGFILLAIYLPIFRMGMVV